MNTLALIRDKEYARCDGIHRHRIWVKFGMFAGETGFLILDKIHMERLQKEVGRDLIVFLEDPDAKNFPFKQYIVSAKDISFTPVILTSTPIVYHCRKIHRR